MIVDFNECIFCRQIYLKYQDFQFSNFNNISISSVPIYSNIKIGYLSPYVNFSHIKIHFSHLIHTLFSNKSEIKNNNKNNMKKTLYKIFTRTKFAIHANVKISV